MDAPDNEQVKKLERLQGLLLDDFIRLAEEGQLTPADRATIARVLKENNFSLDPTKLPQKLRAKIINGLPLDTDEDDAV